MWTESQKATELGNTQWTQVGSVDPKYSLIWLCFSSGWFLIKPGAEGSVSMATVVMAVYPLFPTRPLTTSPPPPTTTTRSPVRQHCAAVLTLLMNKTDFIGLDPAKMCQKPLLNSEKCRYREKYVLWVWQVILQTHNITKYSYALPIYILQINRLLT